MARRSGLGRGLDALFADAAPIYEETPERSENEADKEYQGYTEAADVSVKGSARIDKLSGAAGSGKASKGRGRAGASGVEKAAEPMFEGEELQGEKKSSEAGAVQGAEKSSGAGTSTEAGSRSGSGASAGNGSINGADGYQNAAAGSKGAEGFGFEGSGAGRQGSHNVQGTAESHGGQYPSGGYDNKDTSGGSGTHNAMHGSSGQGATAGSAYSGRNESGEDDIDDRIIYIDINDIRPNSAQPRMNFDEEKLTELAESIRSNGVIQPLIVRESYSGYELVAGERRWRASRKAGLRRVPCIIRNFDDRQNAIVAIIENMQREDLNPIEEAIGLRSMTEKFGFTQEQVSISLGRSRTYIANSIRLLKLPPEIQEYVSRGEMSAAHGRTIINIPDREKQKELADKIIRNDLSVRATEKLAEKLKDELRPDRKKRRKSGGTEAVKSAEIEAVETELMTLTGTKVNIAGDEARGKIELEYYSTEELNRIIDVLREAFR